MIPQSLGTIYAYTILYSKRVLGLQGSLYMYMHVETEFRSKLLRGMGDVAFLFRHFSLTYWRLALGIKFSADDILKYFSYFPIRQVLTVLAN